jgi:hypothetical protein
MEYMAPRIGDPMSRLAVVAASISLAVASTGIFVTTADAAFVNGTDTGPPMARSSALFRECVPPRGTFYTSLFVSEVSCRKARIVLRHPHCDNATCTKFSYRAWSCWVKGGIASRVTRCRKGTKRIVARASGD